MYNVDLQKSKQQWKILISNHIKNEYTRIHSGYPTFKKNQVFCGTVLQTGVTAEL